MLNKENKVFVAKRIDNPKNFWQMPQGGVDEGEDFLKAAYRELEEETSIPRRIGQNRQNRKSWVVDYRRRTTFWCAAQGTPETAAQ